MLTPGTVLQGRYHILKTLRIGGMGAVYLAQDTRLANRQVAVKEMIPFPNASPAEQAQARQQFQREASILASLDHPNLPRVYDYFTEGAKCYLVMDYIDGETLEDILNRTSGFLPESQVLNWAVQLCDVLSYLHNRQPPVIFRDLKPSNIMVDRRGTVKLIDFGIARLFKPEKATDTVAFGTVGYAPPEQYGKGQTDARSDIYALGATLHHLLTKRDPTQIPPFSFPSVRSVNSKVSEALDHAILRAVEPDPNRRWQSAQEMKQALVGPLVATKVAWSRVMIGIGLVFLLLIMGALGSYWLHPWLPIEIPIASPAGTTKVTAVPISTSLSPPLITASNVARLTDLVELNQEAFDLAWSSEGRVLALAMANGVAIYEPAAITQTNFITMTAPLALAFSQDNRLLATGSTDNLVRLWDASSGDVLLQFQGHAAPVTDVAFDRNGQLLASSSEDNSVRVWDMVRRVEQYHLEGHSDWVLGITFSPDGRWLASGSRDHSVRLWNMKNGTAVHTFHGHAESVTSVAIAPDNRLLVSGSEDGTIRLWDIKELTEMRVLLGHLAGITDVAFSPDGRLLASGSRDNTVRIWDVEAGVELRTLKGHTGEVLSVTFAPDGRWLASAGSDGIVRMWGVQ